MPDGRTVALTAAADGTLRIWDLADDGQRVDGMRVIRSIGATGAAPALAPGPERYADLWHCLSDRGSSPSSGGDPVALTVEQDGTVVVRDRTTGKPAGPPLTGHSGKVLDVATTALDGRPVAVTAGADRALRTWDLTHAHGDGPPRTGHTERFRRSPRPFSTGARSPSRQGRPHRGRLWDLATMRQIGGVRTGDTDPNGPMAVTAGGEGDGGRPVVAMGQGQSARFWDLATGREAGNEHVIPLAVGALGAAPGGRLVVGFGPEVAVLRPAAG
ncbi:WD40 repeat domain-containing protein [Streptomyces sp. NPDC048257]|uniref:WD40 repeat domain-containing protein n=1 Tax=Streptomyces sp. NPDC048257 TaxID=3365526 RepID=UPI00371CC5D8